LLPGQWVPAFILTLSSHCHANLRQGANYNLATTAAFWQYFGKQLWPPTLVFNLPMMNHPLNNLSEDPIGGQLLFKSQVKSSQSTILGWMVHQSYFSPLHFFNEWRAKYHPLF